MTAGGPEPGAVLPTRTTLPASAVLHASAVAVGDRALLITGAAGAGKTTLALEMIALGAELIADDRVCTVSDQISPYETLPDNAPSDVTRQLWLSAPPKIAGLVEIRGFGLVRLATRPRAALKLIAELDHGETERLPPRRTRDLSGIACPVILCKGRPGLAAALTCLLRAEDWPGPEFLAADRFSDA